VIIVKTTKSKIVKGEEDFARTIAIYRQACSFAIRVVLDNWGAISGQPDSHLRQQAAERLMIPTRNRDVDLVNNFSAAFYKFPSYLRRQVFTKAIGDVSSHMTRLVQWRELKAATEAKGKKFKAEPPTLNDRHNGFPVFYWKNMFQGDLREGLAGGNVNLLIKVYRNNDWVWREITVDGRSLKNRGISTFEPQAPAIVKRHGGHFLHVPWQGEAKLPSLGDMDGVRVCSADLNLGCDAVCVALKSDGTVLSRRFFRHDREKDLLYKATGRVAEANRESGIGPKPKLWRRITGLNDEIARRVARQIVNFAAENDCHVVVLENLSRMQATGSRRKKVHLWRKRTIARLVEAMAHELGMRFSLVNPKNTSKLAFDGSGEASRPLPGKLLAFRSGKLYNADLNAAYNIAARWVVRTLFSRLSKKQQEELRAKAPEFVPGPCTTLSTLVTGWMRQSPGGTCFACR
jgi:IS605 OrfB family transposase